MKKDQVFKPGFFVSNRIVKLAFKRLEETKKYRRETAGSFFVNGPDRDSPQGKTAPIKLGFKRLDENKKFHTQSGWVFIYIF